MTSFDPTRTLFAGRPDIHSVWTRCAVPAMHLGADWCRVSESPPDTRFATGIARRPLSLAALADYDVVVLQAAERPWIPVIEDLKAAGTTVLYEIDVDLQGLRSNPAELFRRRFDAERVAGMEAAMAACDGVLVPTEYLARRCAKVNPRTWVCRNGVDTGRFALTHTPRRDRVTIGWAGFVGHDEALVPWLGVVARIMRKHPHVRFHSAGLPFADVLAREFGDRTLALPWSDVMSYPAGIVDFDVALAPAGSSPFFRAKSDLRWLEASALGIPTIADPGVYREIENGVTGFHASDPAGFERTLTRLVLDAGLRERVGAAAKRHVLACRTSDAMARDWIEALSQVTARVTEVA